MNFQFYNECSPLCSSNSSPSPVRHFPCEVQLRFLTPSDYSIVRKLCSDWFPVEYPEKWFEAVTSDSELFSLAAVEDGEIIGLIVSELKQGKELGKDDVDILCDSQRKHHQLAYILSLGVVYHKRRSGIASLLLSSLLNHLLSTECKAVYLHVLSSNEAAIRFYEKHRFRVHKFLPYYYSIEGLYKDGFTYVLYLNGGHRPWTVEDYFVHYCRASLKELRSFPAYLTGLARNLIQSLVSLVT